jgi:hypothetical protein
MLSRHRTKIIKNLKLQRSPLNLFSLLLKQMLIICFSQAREPVCFSNCIQLSPSCEVGRSIINGYLTNGDHVLNSSDVSD